MALYVLGFRLGIHYFDMVTQFSTVYFVFSQNLELKFLLVGVFIKITFQHINYPYMLGICMDWQRKKQYSLIVSATILI